MSKHTKGPWSYSFCGGAFYIYGANGGMVACDPLSDAPDGSVGMVRGVGRGASLEEQEANAALMARAPEMAAEIVKLKAENAKLKERDSLCETEHSAMFRALVRMGQEIAESIGMDTSASPADLVSSIAKLKARVAELEHDVSRHVRAEARAVLRLAKAQDEIDKLHERLRGAKT